MYQNGTGVPQDSTEAVRLWRLAADQAVRLFKLAVDQGHAEAQWNLALMDDNGIGVQQDSTEAVQLWRPAADQGLAEAQAGPGVPHDEAHSY